MIPFRSIQRCGVGPGTRSFGSPRKTLMVSPCVTLAFGARKASGFSILRAGGTRRSGLVTNRVPGIWSTVRSPAQSANAFAYSPAVSEVNHFEILIIRG